jgi:GTPase
VLLAANKADQVILESDAGEFHGFGFDMFAISAEHGNGIGDLLDHLVEVLRESRPGSDPQKSLEKEDWSEPLSRELRLAIVGRPNVGKSSLLNRLLGEERAIVSPVAGTTRDTVDTLIESEGRTFRVIDTAGIRRKGKTEAMAEKLSVVMARKSLEHADVAIVVLDAEQGVAALDAAIAGYAVEAGCSIILVLNKWDTIENKDTHTGAAFERKVREQMKFLSWASVVTISALTGQRVPKLLPLAVKANEFRNVRISTSRLNEFFEREITQKSGIMPARASRGSRLHVQYITQIGVRPPKFVVFTAGGKPGLHFSFVRHLENRMREEFGFFATPIRFVERHKSKRRK